MTRQILSLSVLVALLAACTPTASGPVPPRPAQEASTTTTLPSTTTTTTPAVMAAETVEVAPDCPTGFCVIYHIDPEARWSDGLPVTAEDFVHTVAVHDDLAAAPPTRVYEEVSAVEALDEHTVLVAFDTRYGGWQSLFERVIPAGSDPRSVEDLATTGPFVLAEWAEGEYITLERNRRWWAEQDPLAGAPRGEVERLRFVFLDTPEEMVDALEDGEVDVVSARPDAEMVEELVEMEEIEHTISPGPFWEHIDFHHDDPLLSQPWARRALSLAIDREKVLDRTVRSIDPGATTLDNTVWMAGTDVYEPHFDDGFDPAGAEQILVDNGCSRGDDGVYVCGETRMSFLWASTNDDPMRRAIFESVQEDLETVGIEIVGDFRSPSAFVTREFLFGGPDMWQLVNFSWRARPDPIAANPTYYCDSLGDLNVNRYCSDEVEALVRQTESLVDQDDRAAAYNRADRLYLEDRALIPLYQKPTLMAWATGIEGPEPNYTLSGDLWNVASWSGKEEIVVALPSEPAEIDPLSQADDSANVILGALLYGAFGMDPSHQRLPVLVDSVETIIDQGR